MLSNFNLDLAAELNSVQISNPTTLQPELRNCGLSLLAVARTSYVSIRMVEV